MASLRGLWSEYKKGEAENKTREQLKSLEVQIKQAIKDANFDDYNFDLRWSRKTSGNISRSYPPKKPSNPQTDTNQFTESKAEELVSPSKQKLLKEIAVGVLAEVKLIEDYIVKEDKTLGDNPPRRGQIINLTLARMLEVMKGGQLRRI